MRYWLLLLCFNQIFGLLQAQTLDFNLTEVISSASDIIAGIIEAFPDFTPTPEQIVQLPIQLALGLPAEVIFGIINNICAITLATGNVNPIVTPDINKMFFEFRKPCATIKVPLLQAEDLWNHAEFNTSRPVVIVVSGWTTNVNNSVLLATCAKAYNCRDDNNFIALDAARFIDTLYTWSAFNTEEIGRYLAMGIVKLSNVVPIQNLHLIGHSLGAHIVGFAGRFYTNMTGDTLPHITGLDPANPCFKSGQVLEPIERGVADFVDIIHTSPNAVGKIQPLGDIDFYPNGYQPLQPGCIGLDCAHERAWMYYAETVYPNNAYDFPSRECTSLTALLAGFCERPSYPMGYAVPYNISGNYFLEVNFREPFGMNATQDYQSFGSSCGMCNS